MKTKDLVRIAIFSALTAVLSQVVIPIGVVPISLGTFAVYISAMFLSPKNAFISQSIYLLLGVIGLPVFSNFGSGLGHLVGPTGGFALSYPFVALVSAYVISKSVTKSGKEKPLMIFAGYILSTIVCYLFGVTWFCYTQDVSFLTALPLVCYPFIPGDLIKIVTCVIIYNRVEHLEIV